MTTLASVTYIKETRQRPSDMQRVMDYCMQEKKTWDEEAGHRWVSGINCDGLNSVMEFEATKAAWNKDEGIRFYQYVQSFSPEEDITHQQAHELALEFAAKAWPGHEVLVATHCDTDHVHSHFVINSVSFETGLKLRQHPTTLVQLRQLSDEICMTHGFSTLERYEKGGQKVSAREYRAAVKGNSWKFQLMYHIGEAMKRSTNKEDFIRQMKKRGYDVLWTQERKHITYTCPNGMKCRGSKLHDERYGKEMMEYEFAIREYEIQRLIRESADPEERRCFGDQAADSVPTDCLRHPGGVAKKRGAAAGGGGAVPAEAVPLDRRSGHQGRMGQSAQTAAEPALSAIQRSGGPGGTHPATGWEDERGIFLGIVQATVKQHLEAGERQKGFGTNLPQVGPHHGGGVGSIFDAGLRALSAVGRLTEEEEDEEEQRKRIEAQESGQAVGAALGIAIAALLAMQEQPQEEQADPYEEEEAMIWKLSM